MEKKGVLSRKYSSLVEDVETSYWGPHAALYGYSYSDQVYHSQCLHHYPVSGQESFVERMKLVADTVNREYRLGELTLPPLYNTVCYEACGWSIPRPSGKSPVQVLIPNSLLPIVLELISCSGTPSTQLYQKTLLDLLLSNPGPL